MHASRIARLMTAVAAATALLLPVSIAVAGPPEPLSSEVNGKAAESRHERPGTVIKPTSEGAWP